MTSMRRYAPCKHCQRTFKLRGRGLCSTCYTWHADKYPLIVPRSASRGTANGFIVGKIPDSPTVALAGSDEKIRVMAERAARGEALHHPGDSLARVKNNSKVFTGKMHPDTIRSIRRRAAGGRRGIITELAAYHGTTRQHISDIVNRRSYAWVTDDTEAAAS